MKTKTVKMTVNFNNLRKQAVFQLEEITKDLNSAVIKDTQYAKPNDVYHNSDIDIKGYVLIDGESLDKQLNSLISLVNAIACVSEKGNEDFADIAPELPDKPTWFNLEDEDVEEC